VSKAFKDTYNSQLMVGIAEHSYGGRGSVVNTCYNSNTLLITNYFLSNFDGN
jgi:hypothetical protein